MKVRLDCTPEQFDGLHQAARGNSRAATMVRVNRQALATLLTDHSRLIKYIPESDLEGHK